MSVLATDNFNRANAANLGANWTEELGGWSIVSNAAVPDNLGGSDSIGYWNAITWPNDQYSQAKITVTGTTGNSQGLGVTVRKSTSTVARYRLVADHAAANNMELAVFNTAYTSLWQRTQAFTNGDTIYLEAQGTTIIGKLNGVAVGAATTNSAIASGKAGIGFSSFETAAVLDDWEGGDFATTAKAPPPFRRPYRFFRHRN